MTGEPSDRLPGDVLSLLRETQEVEIETRPAPDVPPHRTTIWVGGRRSRTEPSSAPIEELAAAGTAKPPPPARWRCWPTGSGSRSGSAPATDPASVEACSEAFRAKYRASRASLARCSFRRCWAPPWSCCRSTERRAALASVHAVPCERERDADDAARSAPEAFYAHVGSGGKVEADDWMPDDYRAAILKFVEMHANSELMGVLPEREWILRAPTLKRKLALTSKIQDEVGHAQLLYRVAEDLGKPREQMLADLIAGKTKFHNVFHYPTASWGDVGIIAWLVDAAAIVRSRRCATPPTRRTRAP